MSEYLLIEDFKGGLDSRRSRWTAKAGTLYNLIDGHITRGAEIERRKAMVEYADMPTGQTFGLHSANNVLYTFGSDASPSVPSGIVYQQLVHPSGANMTEIIATENFNGGIYAIAKFQDGSIYHYYGGVRVTTWDSIVTAVANNSQVASGFALQINNDPNFIASFLGTVVTVTGRQVNSPFTLVGVAAAGGSGAPTITVAQTQAATASVPEVLAVGSFAVTAGSSNPGVNDITSVKVNGVEVLGASVDWTQSHAQTASNIAQQITAYAATTTPRYSASASGSVVNIKAWPGSGSTPNSFAITTTNGGTVTTGNLSAFAGGVNASIGLPQISTITIGGTFDIGNVYAGTFTIPSTGYTNIYSISGESAAIGTIVRTFNTKVYADASSLLYFSSINDPTQWSITQVNGSGFINISNQDSGSDNLTGLGVYQGKLVVFARRTIQTWAMDADPTKNVLVQTLTNIGTYAPRSVIGYGDLNLFFLSDIGIRSLIPRDASGNAVVSDVGTNIDSILQANIASIDPSVLERAVAILEPTDGRYWLAIGPYIYVYSYFPAANISAWSIYNPRFTAEFMVYSNGIIYLRSGDTVYAYGGPQGDVYDDCQVIVEFPFLDGGKPGNLKTVRDIDGVFEGIWDVYLGTDPNNPEAKDWLGKLSGVTYPTPDTVVSGEGTHLGFKLICNSTGYARLGNFAFTYDDSGPRS